MSRCRGQEPGSLGRRSRPARPLASHLLSIKEIVSCALLGIVLAGCRPSLPFAERAFFSREGQPLPAAADCERCHQEVYLEWRESPHARAFRGEAFLTATHDGRVAECTGCHAPAPLVAGRPPLLRSARLEEGVTCVTCHLSTAPGAAALTMRGPVSRSLPVEVHPVVEADPLYRSSELCGGCHEATFAEWKAAPPPAAGERETCQGCHMPSVHRTVESVNEAVPYSPVLVALEERQKLRRHRFSVPADADEDIELGLERRGAALHVHVASRLPHALPTGSFGRREVKLFVEWPGGGAEHAFAARPGSSLGAGESRDVVIPLPPAARALPVSVSLRRFAPGPRQWDVLARAESSAGG